MTAAGSDTTAEPLPTPEFTAEPSPASVQDEASAPARVQASDLPEDLWDVITDRIATGLVRTQKPQTSHEISVQSPPPEAAPVSESTTEAAPPVRGSVAPAAESAMTADAASSAEPAVPLETPAPAPASPDLVSSAAAVPADDETSAQEDPPLMDELGLSGIYTPSERAARIRALADSLLLDLELSPSELVMETACEEELPQAEIPMAAGQNEPVPGVAHTVTNRTGSPRRKGILREFAEDIFRILK